MAGFKNCWAGKLRDRRAKPPFHRRCRTRGGDPGSSTTGACVSGPGFNDPGETAELMNEDDFQGFSAKAVELISLRLLRTWGAVFTLHHDVRPVFPFINAAVKGACYLDQPEHIRFSFAEAKCTLFPLKLGAAPFSGRDQALEFLDRLSTFINELYAERNSLRPDYRKHRPPSVLDVLKLLPRTNCRRCGHPSCLAFAAALSRPRANPQDCPHLTAPLRKLTIYPLFDNSGNLQSTVAISSPASTSPGLGSMPETETNKSDRTATLERDPAALTAREIQVLRLAATGAENDRISRRLGISPNTVKRHLANIYKKLKVENRTEAAVRASLQGII
ncbi:MAG: LuxR C-terminal-related transcriptional regulator [Pseudomonadota bacterium]